MSLVTLLVTPIRFSGRPLTPGIRHPPSAQAAWCDRVSKCARGQPSAVAALTTVTLQNVLDPCCPFVLFTWPATASPHPLCPPPRALHKGVVSRDDMQIMLRQLAGSSLSDADLAKIVDRALLVAKAPSGLDQKTFREALKGADLSKMTVEVPTDV